MEESKQTSHSLPTQSRRISINDQLSPSQLKLLEKLLTENEMLKTKIEITEEEYDILARQLEGANNDKTLPICCNTTAEEAKYKNKDHQKSVAAELRQQNNNELNQYNGRHYQDLFAEIFAKLKAMRDSSP